MRSPRAAGGREASGREASGRGAGGRGSGGERRLNPECAAVREQLSLLVGGDSNAEETAEVRRHTAECAWCASEQARMTWALRALRRDVPVDRLPHAVAEQQPPVTERMFADMQQEVLSRVGRGNRLRLPRERGRAMRPWLVPLTLAAAALLMIVLEQPTPVTPVVRTTPGARPVAAPDLQSPRDRAFTAGWQSQRLGGQLGGRSVTWQGLEGIRNLDGIDSHGVVLPEAEEGDMLLRRSPLADRMTEEELLSRLPWLEAGPDGWVIRPGKRPSPKAGTKTDPR